MSITFNVAWWLARANIHQVLVTLGRKTTLPAPNMPVLNVTFIRYVKIADGKPNVDGHRAGSAYSGKNNACKNA